MRLLYIWGLLLFAVQSFAVPARMQVFRAKMSDGTYQYIRFCGDERRSFYLSGDGYIVERNENGLYVKTSRRPEELEAYKKAARDTGIGSLETAPIKAVGSPKIPVILVNFSDEKFTVAETPEETAAYYDKYCNGTRDGILYTGAGSSGAVRDYFVQQSDSVFLPDFEIIGPVDLDKGMAYYGQNSGDTKDIHFTEFCSEALKKAMGSVADFESRFDNDGNGTVDLAFFIYAGLPESDRGVSSDAIWPKELIQPRTINGVTVSVMACCSELSVDATEEDGSGNVTVTATRPSGIGTMCHEVSHSLGLPDTYDVNYLNLGMSYWSLMDSGNYCGNGATPCGLTAYERDFLNWRPLGTLEGSATVRLHPLEEGGMGYKVVNPANPDEYYVLENRQAKGWDSALGKLGHGMLVVHVDYDRSAWTNNRLNVDGERQRMTFIPANNRYVGPYNAQSSADLINALGGQPYPGTSVNRALTDETVPASEVYAGGFMSQPIRQIRELESGDIVFKFMPKGVLEAPENLEVREMSSDGFTLAWTEAGRAACYAVEVYGVSDDASETQLVFQKDSVYGGSCRIEVGGDGAYVSFTCRVRSLHDEYEDSPEAEISGIELEGEAIWQPRQEGGDKVIAVYSLNGVLQDVSPETMDGLPKGIYILRTEKGTKKIIVN